MRICVPVITSISIMAVATVLALAGLSGCSDSGRDAGGSAGTTAAGQGRAEGVFIVGMSQCNRGEPWRVQMDADIKAAADKHANLDVVFKDAQNDTAKQRSHVEEFVNAGVDLLIISPLEAQPLTRPVEAAYDAGIPVIVLDRAIIGDKYTCFIGADNKKIGRAAGDWIVSKLGGKGKIIELKGRVGSIPAIDRAEGFHAALKDYPDFNVTSYPMNWLQPEAMKEMESALARFPKIDAVYAHNDPGAYGAYLAAKGAGREEEMLFVGIDGLPKLGVMYVRQGILDATFEYPTGGAKAIEVALEILAGKEVPKDIVLGSRSFTADNVEQGGEPLE